MTLPGSRQLGALLVAAALLLRVAIPAGWMPVVSDTGVSAVPCSGMGPMQMAAMKPPVGHGDHPAPAAPSPCGFDVLALAAPPVAAAAVAVPPAVYQTVAVPRLPGFIRAGIGLPPRPATGPPLSA